MKLLETLFIPKDSANDDLVQIKEVYVKNNHKIDSDTLVIDYETSKANYEIYSTTSGYIKLLCGEGASVKVGEPIAEIYDSPIIDSVSSSTNPENSIEQSFTKKATSKIKELKIEKEVFKDEMLVTESMVSEYYDNYINLGESKNKLISISPRKVNEINNLTNPDRLGIVSIVNKKFDSKKIDCNKYYSSNEFQGSLSILLIKVISDLLSTAEYEHLNSYVNQSKICIYNEVNFGLALNLGDGLKVGIIKNANKLGIKEIENRIIELIDKYIDNKLGIEDVSGATITLTDLTDQKIDSFTPIILKDNSIMVGLSGYKQADQMLTIAFDHRISDGLEISRFINNILKNLIEFSS